MVSSVALAVTPPTTIFDSTAQTAFHAEAIDYNTGNRTAYPEAASFKTLGFGGDLTDVVLDLQCDGNTNDCKDAKIAGDYLSGSITTAVTTNSNTITVANGAAFQLGDLIAGGGTIGTDSVYVTAINGNVLTLSSNVSIASGKGVVRLPTGAVTLSLNANGAGPLPGAVLASVTIYDAALLIASPNIYCSSGNCYQAISSVNGISLAALLHNFFLNPNTSYWIELQNFAGDTAGTGLGWGFVQGHSGTGVTNNYWYDPAYTGRGADLNGGTGELDNGVAWDMMIQYTPEPASLAVLGAGLVAIGLIRRRKA